MRIDEFYSIPDAAITTGDITCLLLVEFDSGIATTIVAVSIGMIIFRVHSTGILLVDTFSSKNLVMDAESTASATYQVDSVKRIVMDVDSTAEKIFEVN